MSRREAELRWPNLEIYGPQWFRVLGMNNKTRSRLYQAKLAPKAPRRKAA